MVASAGPTTRMTSMSTASTTNQRLTIGGLKSKSPSTKQWLASLVVVLSLFSTAPAQETGAGADFTPEQYREMTARLDQFWKRMWSVYYSPKTHLFYSCPASRVAPASCFDNARLDPDKARMGYGAGMADCTINSGILLSMLVDQYEVTHAAPLKDTAQEIFQGLKLCATVHGVPGFVARGVCVEDGKGICITSSRDQYTHFVHGLWRYYHSSLNPGETTKTEIRELLKAVAERMIKNVTPENDYDFLRADGSRDSRGICRMWQVRTHEAARLPMFYAAAWDVCRTEKYHRLYREYLEPAVTQSLKLDGLPPAEINRWMPTYTLIQMQSSLELLYELEADAALKAKILQAMQSVARLAAVRAIRVNGGEEKSSICACGEAALAQLMTKDFVFTTRQRELLYKSIMDSDATKIGTARTTHLAAAFWKARRLGILHGGVGAVTRAADR